MIKILVALSLAASALLAPSASAEAVRNLKDCDGTYSGTYRNVTVQPGGICVLTEAAVVTGGVHAKPGAVGLYVHTEVGRNIQANGVTGTVHVGPPDCNYDPPVGNNVHVTNSHNVLICWVAAGNNIMITRNDGRITVRDSTADNNIRVDRNLAYVADAPGHPRRAYIRLVNLVAGQHVTWKNNHESRVVRVRNVVDGH